MNKRHYEHTLPNIRGSLSNTYSKTDGMIESKQSFNRERKLSVFVERLKGTRIRRKKSFLLSGFLYGTKENTLSVNLNGWKTIKMYHNNSK